VRPAVGKEDILPSDRTVKVGLYLGEL